MMKQKKAVFFSACFVFVLIFTACGNTGGDSPPAAAVDEPGNGQPTEYTLVITGSGVDAETAFTLDEMKALPGAVFKGDFFALNNYGTKAYYEFEGARLKVILEAASIKDNAAQVTFIAEDGYENAITVEEALREDYMDEQNPEAEYPVLIAWEENGEAYDSADGAPFRLVLGQKEPGDVNKPGWVMNIVEIVVE